VSQKVDEGAIEVETIDDAYARIQGLKSRRLTTDLGPVAGTAIPSDVEIRNYPNPIQVQNKNRPILCV
jgi:hypothetical protein